MHNPALVRFPVEAAIIGNMVVGFGELEFLMCILAAKAIKSPELIYKTLYHLRSTSARVESADILMRPAFAGVNLAAEQSLALPAVKNCLSIRNQYAHCNWADDSMIGELYFADLQDSADREEWFYSYKHVDVPLLQTQEAYFGYTRELLMYLEQELSFRRKGQQHQIFPMPPALDRPPQHNPASQHVPRWITEDEKARHIALALKAERPPGQSKREPSVPRLTEEEWRAKCAREAREGRSPAE